MQPPNNLAVKTLIALMHTYLAILAQSSCFAEQTKLGLRWRNLPEVDLPNDVNSAGILKLYFQ